MHVGAFAGTEQVPSSQVTDATITMQSNRRLQALEEDGAAPEARRLQTALNIAYKIKVKDKAAASALSNKTETGKVELRPLSRLR